MAMGRDGLLPSFFSDISKRSQVPVKGTLATGIFIAALAFFMDVSQLAGMVSDGVGNLNSPSNYNVLNHLRTNYYLLKSFKNLKVIALLCRLVWERYLHLLLFLFLYW